MNWFKGTIAEAVAVSKQRNATFVVYVEGSDENSAKLTGYLNHPTIKEKLEKDYFVAVKIEGGSEAYMQFARIYQIVPLPSIFFIGKNGTPLEIATGVIGSISELDKKIDNVLKLTGGSASASAAFITGEQKKIEEQAAKPAVEKESPKENAAEMPSTSAAASSDATISQDVASSSQQEDQSASDIQPTTSSKPEKTSPAIVKDGVICTDAICYKLPRDVERTQNAVVTPVAPTETNDTDTQSNLAPDCVSVTDSTEAPPAPSSTPTSASVPASVPALSEDTTNASKLEEAQKLIEERRKLKQAEEDRRERERELNRRQNSKNTQNFQQWQKEQDFKELKESIRRDRLEDQAARQRILEQIASDRAERVNKFTPPVVAPTTPTPQPTTPSATTNSDTSRIQFRIPNGETSIQSFESADTFATVRAYVKGEVIKGMGIRDFTLTTTFPKHEFVAEDDTKTLQDLGLCPNAVILIIAKAGSGPAAVVARTGGIVNIFNTLFWTLLTPIIAVFGYVRNFIIGGNGGDANDRPSNSGAQKRANEDKADANDLAKKRNLDKYGLSTDGPSTSKEALAAGNSTGGVRRRIGGSNIHRLSDQRKDSDDENNTWNGNSTQQQ